MATVDLRELSGDDFVLHFGGRPNNVDAFTFANSLLSISEALREINQQINPDYSLEIAIDSLGIGSFRARLKTRAKKLTKLLGHPLRDLIIGVLTTLIVEKAVGTDTKIIVNDDYYVVERGVDRIILPKEVVVATHGLREPEKVDAHVSRAFAVMDADPSITDFGITKDMSDPKPLAQIDRMDFSILARPKPIEAGGDSRRKRDEPAKLVIVKLVLEKSTRKWQFIWNGHKISAAITDPTFFARLAAREFEFAQGDALDAILTIHQVRDAATGAYINEKYEVSRVIAKIPAYQQANLL